MLRSEEHTSELQSLRHLVCRLLLEKKKKTIIHRDIKQKSHTHLDRRTKLCAPSIRVRVRLFLLVPSLTLFFSVFFFFFFLNNRPPPEFSPFPPPAPLPI